MSPPLAVSTVNYLALVRQLEAERETHEMSDIF